MRCFLSAGHGGPVGGKIDPGAVFGPISEHTLCREITDTAPLFTRLVEIISVPPESLKNKIAFVNRWSRPGDIAVEIHLNHSSNEAASGCESYYAKDSARGRQVAAMLHAGLVKIGRSPRGVKPDNKSQHSRLAWCRDTKPWAALVEVAFLSNDGERAWLLAGGTTEAGKTLASAIDNLP